MQGRALRLLEEDTSVSSNTQELMAVRGDRACAGEPQEKAICTSCSGHVKTVPFGRQGRAGAPRGGDISMSSSTLARTGVLGMLPRAPVPQRKVTSRSYSGRGRTGARGISEPSATPKRRATITWSGGFEPMVCKAFFHPPCRTSFFVTSTVSWDSPAKS